MRPRYVFVVRAFPESHPREYVARRYVMQETGPPEPDEICIVHTDLDQLRRELRFSGLRGWATTLETDPTVVEVWA